MTTKLFNLITCFLLLTFLVSCGKKNSSGSGTNNSNVVNSLSTNGAQAQTNLLAWYNSSSEGGIPSLIYPTRILTRSVRTFSTNDNCSQQSINVLGLNLGNLNLCFNSSIGGDSTTAQETVVLSSSGAKSSHPKLVEALRGLTNPAGSGLVVTSISQQPSQVSSGSVFVVQYKNSSNKPAVYVIDSGVNSALNPVYSMDGALGKEIKLISIYPNN